MVPKAMWQSNSGVTATLYPSQSATGSGGVKVRLELMVRDRDGEPCLYFRDEDDTTLLQLAQSIQAGLMALTGQSMKDTSAAAHTLTGAVTAGTPQITFGTGVTAATFNDYVIQTAAYGTPTVTATVGAVSTAAGTFTVTGTYTNSSASSVTISEIAMYVTTITGMAAESVFAYTHDEFTGTVVSSGGTAAATLTFTFT